MSVRERASLRNVYLYLVCLITLVMSIFATVNLVRNTAELIYPDPGAYGYEYGPKGEDGLTDQEREEQQRLQRDSTRRYSILGLIGNGTMLLIAGPVYAYHWRKIESELPGRAEPDDEE